MFAAATNGGVERSNRFINTANDFSAGRRARQHPRVSGFNTALVQWADVIFAMEQKHKKYLLEQYPRDARQREIIVLDIPDHYPYMDPELVELIQAGVEDYFRSEDLNWSS